jgi:hypothetical protein
LAARSESLTAGYPMSDNLSQPNQVDWTDNSITSSEQDGFDYQDYAEILSNRILRAGTPLVVGIFGRWGSGKTSLLNLLEAELHSQFRDSETEKSGKLETIRLVVWELGNRDQMWNAFLQALLTTAHQKLGWLERLNFDLNLLMDRVRWRHLPRLILINSYRVIIVLVPLLLPYLATTDEIIGQPTSGPFLIPALSTLSSLILGLWLVVRPFVEAVRSTVSLDLDEILDKAPYEQQITALDQIKKQFRRIVRLWVGKEGRLVVFVDDLDRCTPDQIPEVLEAIKLFATAPLCIYVMALDNDIVQKGIAKHYGFESGSAESAEYLEKIIQIPFHLPPLDQDRVQVFLEKHFPDLNQISASASEVFAKGLEPNPRKVKRAMNIYYTLLDLAERRATAWVMDPVHPGLVAKMVVIQSRFPAIYKRLVQEPEFLFAMQGAIFQDANNTREYYYKGGKVFVYPPENFDEVLDDLKQLVPADDPPALPALYAMLQTGETAFPEEVDESANYIYLSGAAEGSGAHLRPTRKEREALLGNDEEKIKAQVQEILQRSTNSINPREILREYNRRLWAVLDSATHFTGEEVRSAATALDQLRQDFEPEVILVGKYSEGGNSTPVRIFPPTSFPIGSKEAHHLVDFTTIPSPTLIAEREVFVQSELPQVSVKLSPYFIGKYPVTQQEYKAFITDAGWEAPDHWMDGEIPHGLENHPVYNVNWQDAVEYCKWLSRVTGKPYRLPTEEEWEASAGEHIYPWGDDWDPDRANTNEGENRTTTEVGKYSPEGDSPFGVADLAGNVLEWCGDPEWHIAKGGSYAHDHWWARRAARAGYDPKYRGECMGFRVALSPGLKK